MARSDTAADYGVPNETTYESAPVAEGKPTRARGRLGRLPSLDGLRAVSIALVVLWHLPERAHVPVLSAVHQQLWRIDAGNLGVRIFFVISGFLITSLLLAEHESRGRINLRAFYLRRTFRIMPPFYVFLVAMWIGGRLQLQQLSGASLAHAATYTANYLATEWPVGHTWSLSVEEQFYLLWPGLLVLAGLRRGVRGAFAMVLIAPACRVAAVLMGHWIGNPRYTFECVADALAVGCLLAVYRDAIWEWRPYRALVERHGQFLLPILLLLAAAVGARWVGLASALGLSVVNVLIAAWIDWCLRFPGTLVGRVLNAKPIAYIGTLSYSLYLWQQPFLNERSTAPVAPRFALLVACAMASYYLVERPALRIRARLERRLGWGH